MNSKIKSILKTTTVIATIISLIGCTSSPKKEMPVYKQDMDEPLKIGLNVKIFEDKSSLKIYVKDNNSIRLIVKESPLYKDDAVCLKYLSLENDILKEKLGPFTKKELESKFHYRNNDYSINIKPCDAEYSNRSKSIEYQYKIEVKPLSQTAQENMMGVVELFKGIGLWIISVVVIAPIMIIGIIVVGIPFYVYTLMTGGKNWKL